MNVRKGLLLLLALLIGRTAPAQSNTWIQDASPWAPEYDVQSDVVMVYGYHDLPERNAGWQAQGYHTAFMTGVAWGGYQEFLDGRFDGTPHHDLAQETQDGKPVLHDPQTPYMVPAEPFLRYMETRLQEVIDLGLDQIVLEEPEFWARSGYGKGFEREFKAFHGREWVAPHTSVSARYQTSQVQYALYRQAIDRLMSFCKRYGASKGRTIKCYVATHSLINYSAWKLVTPESSLNRIAALDGYIFQVWTGTSRFPNTYRGETRSRTFETAFLEYLQMQDMFAPSGRELIALVDPIEDDPAHGWDDYAFNYKRVLTGALFQPDIARFEMAPWPSRVMTGTYPESEATASQPDAKRITIPADYAAVFLGCSNALAALPQGDATWNASCRNVGVLVADSLMFQREDPTPSDPYLGSFFGLAMPLVKRAMPPRVVSLENLETSGSAKLLRGLDALLLTYEGMKPPAASVHAQLAEWVRAGHGLILVDDGADPYNAVESWWNTGALHFATPGQHLLHELGLAADAAAGTHPCGKGWVTLLHQSPTGLAARKDGDTVVATAVHDLLRRLQKDADWREQAHMELRRGIYRVAANMDEAVTSAPQQLQGQLADLYDPQFAVKVDPVLGAGDVGFFIDLARLQAPAVVAGSTRVRNEKHAGGTLSFETRGPKGTPCRVRVLLERAPKRVELREGSTTRTIEPRWDAASGTCLIEFPNQAATVAVHCTL